MNEDAELPFSGWRNEKGIDARGLANILRPYGIRPKNVRVAFTGQGKGYERGQFENAWARYTRRALRRAVASRSGRVASAPG